MVQAQLIQELEKKLRFLHGKKSAMDDVKTYAINVKGNTSLIDQYIQMIWGDWTYELQPIIDDFETWTLDYEDTDTRLGIIEGLKACQSIYRDKNWSVMTYPENSGARSKFEFYIQWQFLIEVNGYIEGIEECLEDRNSLDFILNTIEKDHSHRLNDKYFRAYLKGLKDGYKILTRFS